MTDRVVRAAMTYNEAADALWSIQRNMEQLRRDLPAEQHPVVLNMLADSYTRLYLAKVARCCDYLGGDSMEARP